MDTIQKEYFSIQEIAKRFGVCRMTIYRLLMSGEIESIRIGQKLLIHESAIADFIERKKVIANDKK